MRKLGLPIALVLTLLGCTKVAPPEPPEPNPDGLDGVRALIASPTPDRILAVQAEHSLTDQEKFIVAAYWAGLQNAMATGDYPAELAELGTEVHALLGEWPTLTSVPTMGTASLPLVIDSNGEPEGGCNVDCTASAVVGGIKDCWMAVLSVIPSPSPELVQIWELSKKSIADGNTVSKLYDQLKGSAGEENATPLANASEFVERLSLLIEGAEATGVVASEGAGALISAPEVAALGTALGVGVCSQKLQADYANFSQCRKWQTDNMCCLVVGLWKQDCTAPGCGYGDLSMFKPGYYRIRADGAGALSGAYQSDWSSVGYMPVGSDFYDAATCTATGLGSNFNCPQPGDAVESHYRFGDPGYDPHCEALPPAATCTSYCTMTRISVDPDADIDTVTPQPGPL